MTRIRKGVIFARPTIHCSKDDGRFEVVIEKLEHVSPLPAATVLRPKTRVRFVDLRGDQSDDGRCIITVALEHAGVCVKGTAQCGAPEDSLRCAATAMINALEQIGATGAFELLGIKAVNAFDTKVVIVAISAKQGDGVQRLVGSCLAGNNPEYSAAVAVLNATNRFMGSTFYG